LPILFRLFAESPSSFEVNCISAARARVGHSDFLFFLFSFFAPFSFRNLSFSGAGCAVTFPLGLFFFPVVPSPHFPHLPDPSEVFSTFPRERWSSGSLDERLFSYFSFVFFRSAPLFRSLSVFHFLFLHERVRFFLPPTSTFFIHSLSTVQIELGADAPQPSPLTDGRSSFGSSPNTCLPCVFDHPPFPYPASLLSLYHHPPFSDSIGRALTWFVSSSYLSLLLFWVSFSPAFFQADCVLLSSVRFPFSPS